MNGQWPTGMDRDDYKSHVPRRWAAHRAPNRNSGRSRSGDRSLALVGAFEH